VESAKSWRKGERLPPGSHTPIHAIIFFNETTVNYNRGFNLDIIALRQRGLKGTFTITPADWSAC
jgi:hypothetical protein